MKRFGISIVAIVVTAGITVIATPAHALGGKRKGGYGGGSTTTVMYLPAPSQPSLPYSQPAYQPPQYQQPQYQQPQYQQPQYQPAPTMPTQYANYSTPSYASQNYSPPSNSPPSPQITVGQPSGTRVPVGATLTLDAPGLGINPGQVVLKTGGLSLPATISSWNGDSVVATLPNVGVTGSVSSQLVILRADGSVASSAQVQLVAAQ